MCLSTILSEKAKQRWLDKQPNTIIAYKTVVERGSRVKRYYPPCCRTGTPYKEGVNEISEYKTKHPIVERSTLFGSHEHYTGRYPAHFHLWVDVSGVKCWGNGYHFLKCEVNKKDITTVGWQNHHRVIVATKFKILEEIR